LRSTRQFFKYSAAHKKDHALTKKFLADAFCLARLRDLSMTDPEIEITDNIKQEAGYKNQITRYRRQPLDRELLWSKKGKHLTFEEKVTHCLQANAEYLKNCRVDLNQVNTPPPSTKD